MLQFERWSLSIVGEVLLRGTSRREDFLSFLGIAPDILALRLNGLVAAGILVVDTSLGGTERFLPTPKGRALEDAIRSLDRWSRDWDPFNTGEMLFVEEVLADVAPETPVATEIVPPPSSIEMTMLDAFQLRFDGTPVDLSPGSQRLLVFLALRDRAIARIALAGTMWPDVSEVRAGDSLRSAIARLEPAARLAIKTSSTGLRLTEGVVIDVRDAQALAHRLVQSGNTRDGDLSSGSIALLSQDLLPDWYDDWIVAEAEDWRHLRMNALEALARGLLEAGMLGEAATAARAAVRIDPLRETPQAILIRVQLAMGDQSAALEVFERYGILLQTVGLNPTAQLSELVRGIER
jgi:DNA-binding SARP family transcriptional activator/DNA-binding HxlR family transcriptional regulator